MTVQDTEIHKCTMHIYIHRHTLPKANNLSLIVPQINSQDMCLLTQRGRQEGSKERKEGVLGEREMEEEKDGRRGGGDAIRMRYAERESQVG